MSIEAFVEKQRKIQRILLDYFDDTTEYQDTVQQLDLYQCSKNTYDFKIVLYLIVNISNNHQRIGSFFSKIDKILQFYKRDILQYFTNSEIFHIFRRNKRIVLFLIEEKILILDEDISKSMKRYPHYIDYFSPEFGNDLKEHEITIFERNRKEGENDNYICKLIRKDLVVDFITYVNQANIPLSAKIKPSVFETNAFLLKKEAALIEYSAFFGSIQIFQYLLKNNAEMKSDLWSYAIHGRNPEIIFLLEENKVVHDDKIIKESIKCHHNEITEYFLDNAIEKEYSCDTFAIKYYNFEFFPKSLESKSLFYYLCKYDYYFLVETLLNSTDIFINYFEPEKLELPLILESRSIIPFKCDLFRNLIGKNSIHAAAKRKNLDVLELLLSQDGIKTNNFCFFNCNEIEKIIIPSSVTSVGDFVFNRCSSLREITIPSSITSIGYSAFRGCSSLIQITIPSSVTSIGECSFNECSSLREITIPSSVTSIGDYAFSGCSSLIQITIPSSVTSIKDYTFNECSSLIQIAIPSSVTSIGNYAFNRCSSLREIAIPSSVTSIGNYTFNECSSLREIAIPSSVTSIGNYTFNECSSLIQIAIPSSVTSIGDYAFSGCSSLTQITIPSSVTLIGDYAFSGCSSLTQIAIPSSVTSIGYSTFSGCSSLTRITIPSSIKYIMSRAFKKCTSLTEITFEDKISLETLDEYVFFKCSSLTKVNFPTSLKSIKRGSFAGCSSLSKISIPSSVIEIGEFAFNGCKSLRDIILPDSLCQIRKCSFKKCESLERIIIPSSISMIESYTFFSCSSLREVVILPTNATIDVLAFPSHTLVIQLIH
ncbi:hypothetical protein M9Y10_031645 [Tritrichomonas musculus]|uniref:Uncharacterized protein n=1 Tax=Tritrichomonas musculus TaxID=1915356 RepID=A0ABR2H378_9EUKA